MHRYKPKVSLLIPYAELKKLTFDSTFYLKPIAPVLPFPVGHWEGNVTASQPIP